MRRSYHVACLVALWWGLASPLPAAADEGRFLLVVSGLGGEEYYSELFARWSLNLLDVAHQRYAMDDEDTRYLAESAATEPARIDGVARKEAVLAAIADLAARSTPGDRVVIVLIGHGTAQGAEAHFNLPGPDLTPAELAAALDALEGRRVAVINTAPASGAFVRALASPGRVVIAATAGGAENQHTRFAGFFIEALANDGADADRDQVISLLEAFRFARHRLQQAYEDDKRLVTEHAQLDDDGDGSGSHEPAPDTGDGMIAHRYTLAGSSDPQLAPARLALQLEARSLVGSIERLKREKRLLALEVYEQRLEALLVELALNRRDYRAQATQ